MCTKVRVLALEDKFGTVAECDCGTLHLTVGSVSVALDEEALKRLHALLSGALKQLAARPETQAQNSPGLMRPSRLH